MRVYGPVFLAAVMLMSSAGALAQTGSAGEAGSLPEVVNTAPVGSRENPARVSSGVIAGLKIHGEIPVYTREARAVSGAVVVYAVIDPEGKVVTTKVISGPEARREPTVEAIRRWTYKPYMLNGQPVYVQTQVSVIVCFGSP